VKKKVEVGCMTWLMLIITVSLTTLSLVLVWRSVQNRLAEQVAVAAGALLLSVASIAMLAFWIQIPKQALSRPPPTIGYDQAIKELSGHVVSAVYVDTYDLAPNETDGELAFVHLHTGRWITAVVPAVSADTFAAAVISSKTHVMGTPPSRLLNEWRSYSRGVPGVDSAISMIWVFATLSASAVVAYALSEARKRSTSIKALDASLVAELVHGAQPPDLLPPRR
jgi:hypothetical protein